MADEKTKLAVIDGETLMDMKLPPTKFCVDTLLPQGLCILGAHQKSANRGGCWICVCVLQRANRCGI